MPSARRRRLLTAFVCTVLLSGGSPRLIVAQPVLPPPRDLLGQLLDETLDEPIAPEQAVQFAVRGDELVVSTALKLKDASTQIHLRGLEGVTRVVVGQRLRGAMGLVPYFELTHTGAASDDGAGSAQTTISAHGGSIRIARTTRVGELYTTITLSQDTLSRRGRPVDPRPERVRLNVRTTRIVKENPQPAPVEDYRLSAPTFAELLRRNPGPAARHLAPLFREFGQDAAIFRVDPRVAWQLFPNAAEADEATASKVLGLVDRLDDDDFRERELATAELEVIGGPAMLVLGEVDRESLSPEQNTRIDAIFSRYRQLDDEQVAILRDDTEFLLRCFTYSDVQPVRDAAVRALERKLGDNIKLGLDPRAMLPARVTAADKLRERLASAS